MLERKATIFNIQKYNMYDGPGVRTLVFFKGCGLRCKWCSNPEIQRPGPEVLFKKRQCVNCGACVQVCPAGVHVMTGGQEHTVDRSRECVGCGRCVQVCNQAALAIAGEKRNISELVDIVEEDRPFYANSGGGLTVGGGEPLMQHEAVANLLLACRSRGINTAMETAGFARQDVVQSIADLVDLFLFDIKHMDPDRHHELTGARNEGILANLRWLLENGFNVRVRMPLLRGSNDDDAEMHAVGSMLSAHVGRKNLKGVDLLPYHKMGVGKYAQLDREYPVQGDPSLDDASLHRMSSILQGYGLAATIVKH